ncbi:MAG: hypothetical protein QXP98_10440 [Thermoproteus sp.]
MYIYLEEPLLQYKTEWVLVKRDPGLEELVEAVKFGLRFAPDVLGFETTIVEVIGVEEIFLLLGLTPSDLGSIYVLFRGGPVDEVLARTDLHFVKHEGHGEIYYTLVPTHLDTHIKRRYL